MITQEQRARIAKSFIDIWHHHHIDGEWDYRAGLVTMDCDGSSHMPAEGPADAAQVIRTADGILIAPLRTVADLLAQDVADEITRIRCQGEETFDEALDDACDNGDWTPAENVIYACNVEPLDVERHADTVLTAEFVGAETAELARRGVELARKYGLDHWPWSLESAREFGRHMPPSKEDEWPQYAIQMMGLVILEHDPLTCRQHWIAQHDKCREIDACTLAQVRADAQSQHPCDLDARDEALEAMEAEIEDYYRAIDAIAEQLRFD